jgi:hypothetical protein
MSITSHSGTKIFVEAASKSAEAHANHLRQDFQRVAEHRPDPAAWHRLDEASANRLEKRRERLRQFFAIEEVFSWLENMDDRIQESDQQLLRRADPDGGSAERFLRAVTSLDQDTANWAACSGTAAVAFWRHASLVWLTLCHAASLPDVTAAKASSPGA